MILERRIPIAYWFDKIKWDLLTVTVFSIITFLAASYFINLIFPISIGAFLGTAISLLLSFKLSHSYERWWEARKIWGAIVNDSRTLVTQLKNFLPDGNRDTIEIMAYRQIAWCYALGQGLRDQNPLENIDTFLDKGEWESLGGQLNVPMTLLDYQTRDLLALHRNQQLNDYQQVQIDDTLVRLCASMGKAERIKNTVFPKTYRLTLHFFIYIFLGALFFSISDLPGILEIPLLISIAIPFFLTEKIAFSIQDPFDNKPTDIAVTSIARTIEINIKQLMAKEEIPEPVKTDKFYIM